MRSGLKAARLAMVAGQVVLAGAASGQWLDNFTRPDGPMSGPWTPNGGSFALFSISDFAGSHTGGNTAMRSTADSEYFYVGQSLDISRTGSGAAYVALAAGYGGTNNLFIKLQANSASGPFDHIGFYSGLNDGAGWAGSTGFEELFDTFEKARIQLFFINGGEKMAMSIDDDFDGRPDQTWVRPGVKAFSSTFGTGMGIGAFGDVKFDNYRVMPTVLPPAPLVTGNFIPFGGGVTATMHQVFRWGLYLSPMRINSLIFFPSISGRIHTNLNVNFGYTKRLAGLASPAGLSVPTSSGGAPNAYGEMVSFFSGADISVNLTAENDAFPFGLGSSGEFVYFPGLGHLLLEVNAAQYPDSDDIAMWRSAGSTDSSRAYTSSLGSIEDPTRATRVQLWAMPYLPDVLPTRSFGNVNTIPFATGTSVTHQVHHAATLSHLADGGEKVAIQGVAYAPADNIHLVGDVNVRMGYTLRQPGFASPAGPDIPNAGGGGAPNASVPMKDFFIGGVNRTFTMASSENYQFALHQRPFVYDPTLGNLLIETEVPTGMNVFGYMSRTAESVEASRAFRTAVFGNGSSNASKIKFITTPVRENAVPVHAADGTLLAPFGRGNHVVDQVFSAAQFGSEPVRISSIAFAPTLNGVYSATDVTVRLGYTARVPNQLPAAGLSIPDGAGDGGPNAAIHPMVVFRTGGYAKNFGSASSTNYQLELDGDTPFAYNPALGNLLVEISAVVPNTTLDTQTAAWISSTQDSSISIVSSRFGSFAYTEYANIVQFSYFTDLYPCLSDLTGDGVVDLSDFFAFFGCFDAGAQCADLDGVPGVDLGDYFAFFNSFDSGCV